MRPSQLAIWLFMFTKSQGQSNWQQNLWLSQEKQTPRLHEWSEPLVRSCLCCLGNVLGYHNSTTSFLPPFINNNLSSYLPSCLLLGKQEHKLCDSICSGSILAVSTLLLPPIYWFVTLAWHIHSNWQSGIRTKLLLILKEKCCSGHSCSIT